MQNNCIFKTSNFNESEVRDWMKHQSDFEEQEKREIQRLERLQRQRERDEITAELTIRRVEMILLERLGTKHIDFIREIGIQVRTEFGF